MKVFISYSKKNVKLVESLHDDIKQALMVVSPVKGSNSIWRDNELLGGHTWWETIMTAIEVCDLFVFALSADSLESRACNLEIKHAEACNKRILPILIGGNVNIGAMPLALQKIQYVDYSSKDAKSKILQLCTSLQNLSMPLPPPRPLPTRPPPPLSPLADISGKLDSPGILRSSEQDQLLAQLKEFLSDPKQRQTAQALLEKFKKRTDKTQAVAQELESLLSPSRRMIGNVTTNSSRFLGIEVWIWGLGLIMSLICSASVGLADPIIIIIFTAIITFIAWVALKFWGAVKA